jgi:5S rRNA maturation endonuclease (ribonuclease M5)
MWVASGRATRNGGYVHRIDESRRIIPTVTATRAKRTDLAGVALSFAAAVSLPMIRSLSDRLGVSVASLDRLGVGWAFDTINHRRGGRALIFDAGDLIRSCGNRVWSFPMRDVSGNVVGIRLRDDGGDKWAVAGGRDGLFVPSELDGDDLLICEGPTDAAALLDLGFNAVGRSCCTGGARLLATWLLIRKPRSAVIVSDADAPGQRGAHALASILRTILPIKIIQPPGGMKDAREWRCAGATTADVQAAIDAAPLLDSPRRWIGREVCDAA